ncbi:MAG TPA: type II secretion system F family protein [Chthonomonadaceae bacterium]|nr:type II secretion system F family protein [Chthonomonadaceae bacterium]
MPTAQPNLRSQVVGRLRALLGDPIPAQELGRFFDHLSTLLSSGMSIPEALGRAALTVGPELQAICAEIAGPVAAGVPLSRALAPWKRRLPEIVLAVLEVGEASGTLDAAARRLAHTFDRFASIERRIRYSAFEPRLIIVIITLDVVAHGFAPTFPALLQQALVTLLQLTCLYLAGRLIVRLAFQWEPLRYVVDTLKLAVPQIGPVLRNLAAARWARSFATLWHSGVPISTALEISSRSALNACYERALRKAAVRTQWGESLSASLAETQLLPPYLLNIIATGETSGNLGSSLEQFTSVLEEQALALATQQFASLVIAGEVIGAVLALNFVFH